jgi:hypothetical protein
VAREKTAFAVRKILVIHPVTPPAGIRFCF